MRTTSAIIKLVMKMNRQMKDGTYPIYLSVSYGGRIERKCGVSLLPRHWNATTQEVKRSCPNSALFNKQLQEIKNSVIQRKNDFEYRGIPYTAKMLMEEKKEEIKIDSYKHIMETLLSDRRLALKTRRKYIYAYKKLGAFLKNDDFSIFELTLPKMKDFAASMHINDGAKRSVLSTVASVWHFAEDKGIVEQRNSPFKEFKFSSIFKDGHRDYYVEPINMMKLKEYWLDLVVERNGGMWRYKDGAFERLRNRTSKEFGILFWLLCVKYNGSAPIDVALLTPHNFDRVEIEGESYWKVSFKRKKTSSAVTCVIARDMFTIIAIEHFLGTCGKYVYPIIGEVATTDAQITRRVGGCSEKAIKWVREAFTDINQQTIRRRVEEGVEEPLVDVEKVCLYTARHSRANEYLQQPNASVSALCSMLSRSPNTIATYIHQLQGDKEIASIGKDSVI